MTSPPPPPKPGARGGLAAPRPPGQGLAQPISQAAAAQALVQPAVAGAAAGAATGRGAAEIDVAGLVAQGAGAATTDAVGQRAGVGQAQGRGLGEGKARGLGAAESRAAAAAQAVAAPRAIGRRDREPELQPQQAAEPPEPVTTKPAPSRHGVTLLGIRAGQLVSWELAVLGVALVHRQRLPILIPVALVAALLIAVTLFRRKGHLLYEWLGLWLRYRTRRRSRRISAGTDAGSDQVAQTLLASVVRGAEIVPVENDDVDVALISHAGGLTAVLEVTPLDAGHVVEPSQVLPPLPALLPSAEIGEPVITVQIIVQSIPAPHFLGLADSAAISYRELAGGVVPATRGCWLALQAEHVAEEYTATQLQESVFRAVNRLQRRLRKSGLRARLLNSDEVATELLSLARVDALRAPMPGRSGRGDALARPAVEESWRTWSAGPQVHTTFRLLDWPDLADQAGRELLDRLVHTPTLATTVTVAARRRASTEELELEAAIRVTLPRTADVDPATKEIMAIVDGVGGRVERLDGEQVFGVAATLPLGGFLS